MHVIGQRDDRALTSCTGSGEPRLPRARGEVRDLTKRRLQFVFGLDRTGGGAAHAVARHAMSRAGSPGCADQCCPDNMIAATSIRLRAVESVRTDSSGEMYSDLAATVKGAKVRISGGYPYAESAVLVTVECSRAGKVKFRIPHWSRKFKIDGCEVTATGGWYETKAPAGAKTWKLEFDMSPRIEADSGGSEEFRLAQAPLEVTKYTVFHGMDDAGMAGMSRGPGKTGDGSARSGERQARGVNASGDTGFADAGRDGLDGGTQAVESRGCPGSLGIDVQER